MPPLAGARNLGLDDPRAVRPDSHCNFGDRSIRACRATAATQRKSRKRAVPCHGTVRHPRPGQANPADVTGQSATGVDGPRTTAAAIGRAGGDERGRGLRVEVFPRPRAGASVQQRRSLQRSQCMTRASGRAPKGSGCRPPGRRRRRSTAQGYRGCRCSVPRWHSGRSPRG